MSPNPTNSVLNATGSLGYYVGPHPEMADDGFHTILALQKVPTGWLSPSAWVSRWRPLPDGAFAVWAQGQLALVNVRLSEITGLPAPVLTVPAFSPEPQTWEQVQAWFIANTHMNDGFVAYGPAPVHAPTPADDVTWGPRAFHGGYAWDLGIEDGTKKPAARVMVNGTWKRARVE